MVLPCRSLMTARPIDAVRPEPMTPWRSLARPAGFESCAGPPKRCRYAPSADLRFGSHRAVVAAVRSRIRELHQILDLATLRRERDHGNKRGPARFCLDPQLAAELLQARARMPRIPAPNRCGSPPAVASAMPLPLSLTRRSTRPARCRRTRLT